METGPSIIVRADQPGAMPVFRPMVAPELVAEMTERRFADEHPEAAETIAELRGMGDFYQSVAVAAEKLIKDTVPIAELADISTSDGFSQSA